MAFNGLSADYIIAAFKHYGITTVFNYPGGTIAPLLDACDRYNVSVFTSITEQGAGYAAISTAKLNQSPALVAVTSGPGVTNLCTCIAEAYFDSVPLIALTGQVASFDLNDRHQVRQKGFQEVDACRLFESITKRVFQPRSVDEIPAIVHEAYRLANTGRKGPVVIDLPMDIQRTDINTPLLDKPNCDSATPDDITLNTFITDLLAAIKVAQSPVIICGSGTANMTADTLEKLRHLIAQWNAPVSHSLLGLGTIDSQSPQSLGYHGHTGHPAAGKAIHQADLILSLGSRLDIRQTGNQFDHFSPNATIFKVDYDRNEIEYSRIRHDHVLVADVQDVVEAMWVRRQELAPPDLAPWYQAIQGFNKSLECQYHNEGINPGSVIKRIHEMATDSDIITVTGVGLHQHWAARECRSCNPSHIFLTSGGHGTMGYDLPSAIGAAYARPEATVICFVGDGSLQMNIQELTVLADNHLNVKIIVLNNRRLGLVSQFQLQNWDSDIGCGNKSAVDFSGIARAYGIRASRIDNVEQVDNALASALSTNDPYLLDITISEQHDILPMLLGGHSMDDMSY